MQSALPRCPICSLAAADTWIASEHAIAFAPPDSVDDGHIVIAPRKHVGTIYELTAEEQAALWRLSRETRDRLLTGMMPRGFYIGFVEGEAVEHDHIHIVPRRDGDVPEPRPGIRWIAAENAP